MADQPLVPPAFAQRRTWYLRGCLGVVSIPGLILVSAFIGFASLAKGAGLTLGQSVFMTGAVWALPAQVVLVGAILAGISLPGAAFAVALSSVRLMPMVVALMPELKGSRTPRWVMYGLSHFVAVTSWVLAMENFRRVPRDLRTSYYFGLGSTLTIINMIVVAVFFTVADSLPSAVSAALLLVTPVYFLGSLWGSAREKATYFALLSGMALGPAFHILIPRFDLVAAGLVGGGGAYAVHRMQILRMRS